MRMKKLNVAVLFGGRSPEHEVSLTSAAGVLGSMDKSRFEPVMIGISKGGGWYCYDGPLERITDGTWQGQARPAVLSQSPERKVLYVLPDMREINIDVMFPVLHGRNGEDGTVQALAELADIPLAGCGVLASALAMDKERAHRLAASAGIAVPRSVTVTSPNTPVKGLEPPLFVKPLRAGSSFGISRVADMRELPAAVELALKYDTTAIIEEEIPGFEVGCAVMGNDELITGIPDEIEISGGFFDFEEKYTLKTSEIHLPARVSADKLVEIQETAKKIYRALGCRVLARVDMFLTPEGRLVFNEVNTVPGFTPHSRFPSMMRAAGFGFGDVVTRAIELAVER